MELPSELSWFRVSFDFQPSLHLPAAPGLPLIWCKLQQRAGDTFPGVSLASRSDGTSLLIQNYDGAELSYREYRLPALPGGWTRIELALTFGERGGVRVGYDGELAMEYAEIPIGSRQVVQTAFELGLFSQQTPASSALYDNVVIDYR